MAPINLPACERVLGAIRRQWRTVRRTALQQRRAVTLHEAVQWARTEAA